jgi:RNA polymerase sigma-70 factor (ECF subfamily)
MRDYQKMSVDELVAEWANHNDSAAFLWLEEEYRGKTARYLERFTNGAKDAPDLNLKAWVRICLSRSRVRSASDFETRLWAVTKDILYDWLRQQGPQAGGQLEELLMNWMVNHLEELAGCEFKEKFQRAWARLPPEYQAILKLKYLDDLTVEQIAQRERIDLPRARKRYRLAQERLKLYLVEEGIPVADPLAIVPAAGMGDDEDDQDW